MLNLYDAHSAYLSLKAHFQIICNCLKEEVNDFEGVRITEDAESLIIDCFGLTLMIQPVLGIDDKNNPAQKLLVTKTVSKQSNERKTVAKLVISDRCVVRLEGDDESPELDFGKLTGRYFHKLPTVNDFLAIIISKALKEDL